MDWLSAHWVEILAVIGAVDILLGVVSKWTPWKWDDSVYTFFHTLVDKFFRPKT